MSSFEKGNGIIDSVQYDGYVVRSVQNFNECIYVDTELYNPDKRDFVLLGRKRKRKIKK